MPNKPVELTLADNETKVSLRPITKHPDDKECARLFYHVEQFANQTAIHLGEASKSDDVARITKLTELAAEIRIVRDEKFAAFLKVYLKPMSETEVLSKVVAQCGEDEMDFILATVRASTDWLARELDALVYGSPVQTFETLTTLLKKTPAGREYLLDYSTRLSVELTPVSTPSGTTPAGS